MIDIYLLEQLDAFASCENLSKAAEQLHMTQPTLSRSMQKLEDYFGFPLFEREKKKVRLNESGRLLADYAGKILDQEAEMERHVRSFHRSLSTLHIGSVAPGPLMELLPKCAALYPNITVASTLSTEESVLKGLSSDDFSIAVLTHPVNKGGYVSQEYVSEQLNLSVSIMHPVASKSTVSFSEMNGQNFIMYAKVGFWEEVVKSHMPASSFFKQESKEALEELRRFSELPAFTTDLSLRHGVSSNYNRVSIPFSDPEARITYYLVTKADNYNKWKLVLNL